MTAGGIIGITGRPQSGKSTLARAAVRRLRAAGVAAVVLDGDEVRRALVPPPGYSDEEREAFYATLANLAGVLAAQGLWVAVAATLPRRRYREQLRARAPRFLEVFVDATREQCEARDSKGLYERFRKGLAPTLPGAGATYEAPVEPDVVASGGRDGPAAEAIAERVTGEERRSEHRPRRCGAGRGQ
ncbi:MAG TPA: adenylyl-sulfate kinase [Myxococcales bacterium]|nr:adenylyl-sulfate kinase [Myxococcales bacterium]